LSQLRQRSIDGLRGSVADLEIGEERAHKIIGLIPAPLVAFSLALDASSNRAPFQLQGNFGNALTWNFTERGCAQSASRSVLKMLRLVSDTAELRSK
jgi:hypothetical protein